MRRHHAVELEKVLRSFRDGRIEVLTATDVAARGLDIPEVALVINFDIPPDPEYYVHRIGRTGRLGRGGEAITFVNPREMRELDVIQRVTGAKIRRGEIPTVAEAQEREAQLIEEQLLDVLARGNWGPYRALIEELAEDHDPVDIAAAAVAMAAARRPAVRRAPAATFGKAEPRPSSDREMRPRREAPQRRPAKKLNKRPGPRPYRR
jgi:ATP-dependent RNA helicase DeaD